MSAPPSVEGTLARLIAWPTVSSRPMAELGAYVAERCERAGFRVEMDIDPRDPGKMNVVARAGEGPGGLLVSGHLDVVPTEGQSWSSDPFVLAEREGRLYGRGTSDMKGFVAATLEAVDRLDLSRLRQPLVLAWTHDEETGCVGSARLVERLRGQILPSECLIGEPTDFRILRMHPGHVAVRITALGQSAHSSKPDLGANAIKAIARVLAMLEGLEIELRQERRLEQFLDRPYVTMNTGEIHGGVAVNMVPDRCVLMVGYRPLPGDDPEAVFQRMRERLEMMGFPRGTRVEAEILRVTRTMHTEAGTPLQALLHPHSTGEEPAACSFATDGGNFATIGVKSLVFGPGSIDVAHAPDEYVEARALHRAVDVIERVVHDRCIAEVG